MAITSNVGGVLKTLNTISTNVGGIQKALNVVYSNVGGALQQIHSSKPQTLTGTCASNINSGVIATNVTIPSDCTITFSATFGEIPSNYGKGGRSFVIKNAAGETVQSLENTSSSTTSMYITTVLPAGVYTFQVVVFNVYRGSYDYPTVTYTVNFS